MKEPAWVDKAASGRVTPLVGSFIIEVRGDPPEFALGELGGKLSCMATMMVRERFVGINDMLGGGDVILGSGNTRWWPVQGSNDRLCCFPLPLCSGCDSAWDWVRGI